MPSKDSFNDREIQVLACAFQCLKDPSAMQVDYQKLAEAAGYHSIGGAQNAFNAIKKKLLNGIKINNSPTATPKKNAKKAFTPAAPDAEDGGGDNDAGMNDSEVADNEKTPGAASLPKKPKAKASRKPKAKANPIQAEEEDDAELAINDEDTTAAPITPAKPKRKYTRKPKDPNAPPAKRAKKQATTPPTDDDDEQANADNNENDEGNTSIFGVGDKAVKAEDGQDGDFLVQTASQEQFAAENALVPDAV